MSSTRTRHPAPPVTAGRPGGTPEEKFTRHLRDGGRGLEWHYRLGRLALAYCPVGVEGRTQRIEARTSSPTQVETHPSLPEEFEEALLSAADRQASASVGQLRTMLGPIGSQGGDLSGVAQLILDQRLITFRELIHTTYFDYEPMRQSLAGIVTGQEARPEPESAQLPRHHAELDWQARHHALREIVLTGCATTPIVLFVT